MKPSFVTWVTRAVLAWVLLVVAVWWVFGLRHPVTAWLGWKWATTAYMAAIFVPILAEMPLLIVQAIQIRQKMEELAQLQRDMLKKLH